MRTKTFTRPTHFISFFSAPNSFVRSKIIVMILSFVSSHISFHFISFHFFFLRPILRSARFFNSFSHSICILFFDYRKIINKIGIDSRIRRHNEMKLDILYVIFFKAYGMRFYKEKEEK